MATTTAAAIRDRARQVIRELVPRVHADTPFEEYLSDVEDDFRAAMEANPAAAFRQFFLRTTGDDQPASHVSNCDIEERELELALVVAFPKNNRTGEDGALDRDDAATSDRHQLESAIGMRGRANFSAPFPDACWLREGASASREDGQGVDFLVIRQRMLFVLDVS